NSEQIILQDVGNRDRRCLHPTSWKREGRLCERAWAESPVARVAADGSTVVPPTDNGLYVPGVVVNGGPCGWHFQCVTRYATCAMISFEVKTRVCRASPSPSTSIANMGTAVAVSFEEDRCARITLTGGWHDARPRSSRPR